MPLLLILSQLAAAKETYQRVIPPPTVVAGLRKVAIVSAGDNYDAVAQKAIAEAVRSRLGYREGVPESDAGLRSDVLDFSLVPAAPLLGAGEIVALAAANHAQVVVFAEGDGAETAYETFEEERKGMEGTGENRREVTWTVACARREVQASWSAKIYAGSDGSQVTSDSGRSAASDRDCDEKGDDPLIVRSADQLITGVVSGARDVLLTVSPRWQEFKVGWAKEDSTKPAIASADAGDWVTAVELSVATLADDPYNAASVYHLGLWLELSGRAEEAAELYKFASRMKSDNTYTSALTRARTRKTELDTLAEVFDQHVRAAPLDAVAAVLERARAAAAIPVAGAPLSVKGAKNKRIPVFESAAGSGAPIAMVPGGTEVRQLAVSGAMLQIQLPDGASGFIDAKEVK